MSICNFFSAQILERLRALKNQWSTFFNYSQTNQVSSPNEVKIVPNSDHILRYIRPTDIDQEIIGGSGFLRRNNESSTSVNWLECFNGDLNTQVEEIRRRARIRYAATGRLARLNVGKIREYVETQSNNVCRLRVVQDPLPAENNFEEDPSHALIEGIPSVNDPTGEFIGDLIAECLMDSFPARS